ERPLDVSNGARNVFQVLGAATLAGHVAEGAEVLEISLQSRKVEVAPELFGLRTESAAETVEHLFGHLRVQVERRVAKKRCGVVRVGAHAGVLEIDETEAAALDHQVRSEERRVGKECRTRA